MGSGVDDDACSSVSLTALRGLVKLLPKLPPDHLQSLLASLALKVRPFFESSSEDHRAASISIYSCLGRDTGQQDARSVYLDYAGTVLLPVLLHSNSAHEDTRNACRDTLLTIAKATQFKPLIDYLSSASLSDDYHTFIAKIVECRCGPLIEMYSCTISASLSYFRSQNPHLRRNVIILLTEVMSYTQSVDTEMITEETLSDILNGMVGMVRDQDKEVRRTAAEQLGRVTLLISN